MELGKISLEKWIYGLAFLAALFLRFIGLGNAPLSEYEASLALQALQMANGTLLTGGAQPGYVSLTSILFALLGATNFLARFWPALAGSILVVSPFFFRNFLGRRAALLLAFFLAFDPALTAASRQADGRILAVGFLAVALGFLAQGKTILSGVFLGLALLGGPFVWEILIIFAVVFAWQKLARTQSSDLEGLSLLGFTEDRKDLIKDLAAGMAITVLTACTWFMFFPGTLSAAGQSVIEYLAGWKTLPADDLLSGGTGIIKTSFLRTLVALFTGELFFLILAAWQSGKTLANRKPFPAFFSRWFVTALLIVLIYSSRQPLDLIAVSIPMLALAASQMDEVLSYPTGDRFAAWGNGVAVFVLLGFAIINLAGLTDKATSDLDSQVRLLSAFGAFSLAMLVTLLVAWGWSVKSAVRGSLTGLALILILFTLSTAWRAGGLGRLPSTELWRLDSYPADMDLLVNSLEETSRRAILDRHSIDIQILGLDSDALRWALRDFRDVSFVNGISADAQPGIIISDVSADSGWGASYTGQDFVQELRPAWELMQVKEWLRWLIFREAPQSQKLLVMWVRSDLFPGGAAEAQ